MSIIQTVTGLVEPESLGFTLPHEHVHLEMWDRDGQGFVSQIDDDEVLAAELEAFRDVGGTCLVDQTPRSAGRRPARLRALSERTGIKIVCSTGWYTEPYYPPEERIGRQSVAGLEAILRREIEDGIGDSGVKPGLIGEIGASQGWVSPIEERVHRAAARAQVATGLPLATHTIHHGAGIQQMEIFDDEGVDPGRVVIGHSDTFPSLEYCLRIAEWGGYVAFDNIGFQLGDHEAVLVRLIADLIERGHTDRLVLSHDMGQMTELGSRGGRGLTYISTTFLPLLAAAGIDEETRRRITADNPLRWLGIAVAS
jgi:phosphotriesterase-related protein